MKTIQIIDIKTEDGQEVPVTFDAVIEPVSANTRVLILGILGYSDFSKKPTEDMFKAKDLRDKIKTMDESSPIQLEDSEYVFLKNLVMEFSPLKAKGLMFEPFYSLFKD